MRSPGSAICPAGRRWAGTNSPASWASSDAGVLADPSQPADLRVVLDRARSQRAGRRTPMPLLVGTSGWQYRDWRGTLYPPEVPLARWLDYYAATFPAVANNGTFYRLAKPETFADWRARTPDGFQMAVKASRYLTHVRRLRDPAQPVSRLLAAAARLRDRLGPVLLQLPPTLQADRDALDQCLGQFAK